MRLVLAIASYNGDPAAQDLAGQALSSDFDGMFTAVAVIDSGDDGACARLHRGLVDAGIAVLHVAHEGNLGAAGNLVSRIRWAEAIGAEALLAVNADGRLDPTAIKAMVRLMEESRAAAVYPTAILEGERVDLSYTRPVPVWPSRRRLSALPSTRAVQVCWGSSNGALYALDALREVDLEPILDVWHGWEDLSLGLALRAEGSLQLMSLEARLPSSSDQRRLAGAGPIVSDKPPWTSYYTVRNLVLIGAQHAGLRGRVLARLVREFVFLVFRDQRRERSNNAWRGLRDGLIGRGGQQIDPVL